MKKILGALSLFAITVLSYAEEAVPPSPVETFLSKGEGAVPSYEGTFVKMLLTLGGLVVLVFLTMWLVKKATHGRLGGFGSQKKINILEKKPLSPKTLLYLIELEGKKILISESQLEVRALFQPAEEDLYN